MKIKDANRQLQKIQTLIEDLVEEFPDTGDLSDGVATAFSELEDAGKSIDAAIDLLSSDDDEDEEGGSDD